MKIGVIGLGNMATAMIGGIIKAGLVGAENISGSDYSQIQADKAKDKFEIETGTDNVQAMKDADYIIMAVKPQIYESVLPQIKENITDNQVLISIAPGKTLTYLEDRLNKGQKIVRLMPNTPALVAEGCTGVCRNENVTNDEFDFVLKLLSSFGKAYEVKENQMDAVVAVSGSSPAYVFMLIDAMADGAVAQGLDRKTAISMAAQAVLGSAKMVLETGEHPAVLKDMVCSPAGTTIDAVNVLEQDGFKGSITHAMQVCADKSRSM